MKKVFLLVMLVAGILFGAEAQNRSINFEQTKVWKQIVKKAKKEKKLIFVDCYTSPHLTGNTISIHIKPPLFGLYVYHRFQMPEATDLSIPVVYLSYQSYSMQQRLLHNRIILVIPDHIYLPVPQCQF